MSFAEKVVDTRSCSTVVSIVEVVQSRMQLVDERLLLAGSSSSVNVVLHAPLASCDFVASASGRREKGLPAVGVHL